MLDIIIIVVFAPLLLIPLIAIPFFIFSMWVMLITTIMSLINKEWKWGEEYSEWFYDHFSLRALIGKKK